MPSNASVLILGVGNFLLGDEGVGVHVVHALEHETLPASATLVDGGTGGFHLLSYLQEYPVIILIDATMDGQAAGTVRVLRPRFAQEFPRALSAHDIGLRDLIESAILVGQLPDIHLITISVADLQEMGTELSPAVRNAVPSVVSAVKRILAVMESEIR
jgi:hydrogenase maturation protease